MIPYKEKVPQKRCASFRELQGGAVVPSWETREVFLEEEAYELGTE